MIKIRLFFLIIMISKASLCMACPSSQKDAIADLGLTGFFEESYRIAKEDVKSLDLLLCNKIKNAKWGEIQNVLLIANIHPTSGRRYNLKVDDFYILVSFSKYINNENHWEENTQIGKHELPGVQIYERKPTNQDIYIFLGQGWNFAPDARNELIEGVVYSFNWERVIGQAPERHHQVK